MGFLHDIKIKILKRSIEKALRENIFLRGFEALFLENEIALNHCCADELTAEEAILYTLREYLKTPPAFSSLRYLASSIPWGEYESPENTSKGDWWFWVSKKWRDEGKVELSQFEKFLEQLDFTKKKWPQIFSGEDLTTARSYWEVHFNSYPVGLGTTQPSDIGDKTNIKARFYGFQKAVQYVKNNALEELWWHYYNLGVVKDGHVDYWPPAWEYAEHK